MFPLQKEIDRLLRRTRARADISARVRRENREVARAFGRAYPWTESPRVWLALAHLRRQRQNALAWVLRHPWKSTGAAGLTVCAAALAALV